MPISEKSRDVVRLKDVAKEANVSIATVSMALRNNPSISKETRERVFDAQKKMGYRPSRNSSSNNSKTEVSATNRQLCFMYCLLGYSFETVVYMPFLDGILQTCHEKDFRIELGSMEEDGSFRNNRSKSIPEWIDGVILAGNVQQDVIDSFLNRKLKVVVLGNHDVVGVHAVGVDIFRAGEMVARRAMSEGYRNFVFLQQNPKNYFERRYLLGIMGALADHGFSLPAKDVFHLENSHDSVIKVVDHIASAKETPAVFANAGMIGSAVAIEFRRRDHAPSKKVSIYCLATSEQNAARLDSECHILNLGLERSGELAIHRLCQIVGDHECFSYESLLAPTGWLQ
ncbi:maltose operon transcriptional repressor MalR [soil metagenome]